MTGLIFVTTPKADKPLLNRLLLYLRAWEHGNEGTWDRFQLVRSKTATLDNDKPSIPPLEVLRENEWVHSKIPAIEKFILKVNKARDKDKDDGPIPQEVNLTTFLILDEKGLEDRTIILLDRASEPEALEYTPLDKFDKVRLPWEEAESMWGNLDIANMGFVEFCDRDRGADKDGWWTFRKIGPPRYDPNLIARWESVAAAVLRRRTITLKALEELGHA